MHVKAATRLLALILDMLFSFPVQVVASSGILSLLLCGQGQQVPCHIKEQEKGLERPTHASAGERFSQEFARIREDGFADSWVFPGIGEGAGVRSS
jgi:hypothetical protein